MRAMSELMLFQNIYQHRIPANWAGKVCPDADIGDWLYKNYGFRVIGRMVKGPAWPEFEVSPEPETSDQSNTRKHPRDEKGAPVIVFDDIKRSRR
ncbi:hypothetical protein SLS62_000622 [Diatrype stigma]|uniref:Uncharacterized protein n=1 Tax=Diatrype stigma TaxID=117547 RepID=A0AAN9YWV8_9PEZI